MPIPKTSKGEQETEYIGRCMKEIGSEYDDNTQAVAICYNTYRTETKMSGVNLVASKISEIHFKTQLNENIKDISTKE